MKIIYQEVVDMIEAAKAHRKMPTIGARNQLLLAVYLFGGNEFNANNLFSSPEDVAALKATTDEGIEMAPKFGRSPIKSQLKFIRGALWGGEPQVVDFNTGVLDSSDSSATMQARVNAILQSEILRAGKTIRRYAVHKYQRLREGVRVRLPSAVAKKDSDIGFWYAEFLLDQTGDTSMFASEYEPMTISFCARLPYLSS